ncbi:MAG: MBL fold metallo-hydrolase [Ruminococcaceae bacterium]|nr:MBL fold metallo-hydrolase [Oscillospiraceae bacterium]
MPKIRDYRIVLAEKPTYNERRAAAFVRSAVRLITGKTLETVSDSEPPIPYEIVIGKTTREALDGLFLERSRKSLWEYVIRFVGDRLYLTGLGLPAEEEDPYKHPYGIIDDGAYGTSIAAYRFTEDVLGYDFLFDAYGSYTENPDLVMPANYAVDHFKDALEQDHAPKLEGTGFWAVPSARVPAWNMGCLIFRSREGRIVLIDGGLQSDAPRIIRLLQEITGKETPVIDALLFTHLHPDHYGFYRHLCLDEALREKVRIKAFYHHLLPDTFYSTHSKEKGPEWQEVLDLIQASPEILGTKLCTVEEGDVITVDDLSFKVLHVPSHEEDVMKTMNMNDSSVIYRMDHESGQRMLLLADGEWVVSNALSKLPPDQLRAELVQVGHHGVGNVSHEIYRRIGGKVFLYQVSPRFWYSDRGEGQGSHVIGMARNLHWLMEDGALRENILDTSRGIVARPLPLSFKTK